MAGFFNTDFGCTCEIAGQEIQETVCGCNIKPANRLTATSNPCFHVCIAPIFANIAVTGIVLYTCSIKLIAMQLCRICTIEDANGINGNPCILHGLSRCDCAIGNIGIKLISSRRHAICKSDYNLLTIRIAFSAVHQFLRFLHTSPDIRCPCRLIR